MKILVAKCIESARLAERSIENKYTAVVKDVRNQAKQILDRILGHNVCGVGRENPVITIDRWLRSPNIQLQRRVDILQSRVVYPGTDVFMVVCKVTRLPFKMLELTAKIHSMLTRPRAYLENREDVAEFLSKYVENRTAVAIRGSSEWFLNHLCNQ